MATILRAEALSKNYSRGKNSSITVIDKVNLEISAGDFVVIYGRSGAGKTTLLNLLAGLDTPSSGTVFFEKKSFSEMTNEEISSLRLKKIGFIFQNFNLLNNYTVFENIEIALLPTSLSSDERRSKIEDLLCRFGLKDKADYFPLELSLGQQQKIAIIRVLSKNPTFIFADEPTAEVDSITAQEIVENLVELNQKHKITFLVVTHGIFPLKVANKVFLMENSKIFPQKIAKSKKI
jgi:putative ABC transport system ATP-binding protein